MGKVSFPTDSGLGPAHHGMSLVGLYSKRDLDIIYENNYWWMSKIIALFHFYLPKGRRLDSNEEMTWMTRLLLPDDSQVTLRWLKMTLSLIDKKAVGLFVAFY